MNPAVLSILRVFAFCLISLGRMEAAAPLTEPPQSTRAVLLDYCKSLDSRDWDAYRSLFCLNSQPKLVRDPQWKNHAAKYTLTKTELLFQENNMMIARLYMDVLWTDYKPAVLTYEASLLVLRMEGSTWKIWSVTPVDSGKKG